MRGRDLGLESRPAAMAVLSAILGLALAAPQADAAPGDLDPSFGSAGTAWLPGAGGVSAIAIQSDQKVVVAESASGPRFSVTRLNPDGTADTAFGGDGSIDSVVPWNPEATFLPRAVTIDANGRILVAGTISKPPESRAVLVRILPDGTLDASFAGDGIRLLSFGGSASSGGDVVVQQNGRIVIVGQSGGANKPAAGRVKPNGRWDRSFAGDGARTIAFDSSAGVHGEANAVAVLGATLVLGGRWGQPPPDREPAPGAFALAALKRNGKLQRGFGDDGRVLTSFGGADELLDIAVDADGRIVAAGTTYPGGGLSADIALARYDGDGALDPAFGTAGRVTANVETVDSARGVAIQRDGRIVVAGAANFAGLLMRYASNGSLDSTFSGDGVLVLPSFYYGISSVALDSDDRCLVPGFNNSAGRNFLARVLG
jgi:uncharacterized delta-60 repeat protein